MVWNKRVSDEDLIRSYQKTNSVWKTAKELGLCGQNVHRRLVRLGINKHIRKFSEEEKNKLKKIYNDGFLRGDKKLQVLSKELNRTIPFLVRQARKMGLTNNGRKVNKKLCEEMGERTKRWIKEKGHPKGMLGKHHSEELKISMSKNHKEWYLKKENKEKLLMWIEKGMKTKLKKYGTLVVNVREKCSWKAGWREIGGKRKYFRSKWEANYARFLEWLKQHGQIKEWQHENKTFWFEGIKRGCRSYLPDFEVTNNDGSVEYHEVKGWYDSRSQTKIKRMKKYYPDVKLLVIFGKQYNEIKNKVGRMIPEWE